MVETGVVRYTPYALVGLMVFEYMHIADELAGSWAPFEPFNIPMVAAVMVGAFTLVGTWSLWWMVTDRPWGYGLALLFGLFFLIAEFWHYFDPAHMTTFRWSVVILSQVFAVVVVILSTKALLMYQPWRGTTDGDG